MDQSKNMNCFNFAEKFMSLVPINVISGKQIQKKATNPHVHAFVAISVKIFDRPASADYHFNFKSFGECSIKSIGENEDSVVHKTRISEKLKSLLLNIEVVCGLEVLIYNAFTVQMLNGTFLGFIHDTVHCVQIVQNKKC